MTSAKWFLFVSCSHKLCSKILLVLLQRVGEGHYCLHRMGPGDSNNSQCPVVC